MVEKLTGHNSYIDGKIVMSHMHIKESKQNFVLEYSKIPRRSEYRISGGPKAGSHILFRPFGEILARKPRRPGPGVPEEVFTFTTK